LLYSDTVQLRTDIRLHHWKVYW